MISYNNTYPLSALDNINYKEYYNNKIKSYKIKKYIIESTVNNVEYINNIEYNTEVEEIKYKILDDITYITKNRNNIELVITLPNNYEYLSIVKIKLSKEINNYIKDIYIKKNNEIVLTKDKLLDIKVKNINNLINNSNNQINNVEELNLHIIIEKNSLNYIINSYIYILFSFVNIKNKIKSI